MTTAEADIWRSEDVHDTNALANLLRGKRRRYAYKPEFLDMIEATINHLSDELRELSLSIHGGWP